MISLPFRNQDVFFAIKAWNPQWQLLFSCIVWNLWLHRNDVIFNGAAPNLQLCFSMVDRSFTLWLRLDSNSLDLDGKNVDISCDTNGSAERRSWFQLSFLLPPCFPTPVSKPQNLVCFLAYFLFISFADRTFVTWAIIFIVILLLILLTIIKKKKILAPNQDRSTSPFSILSCPASAMLGTMCLK
jgi:hypothetical protein